MPWLRPAAILLACVIILLVLQDVFEVLLLPRRVGRRRRLATTILRPAWYLWRRVAASLGHGLRPVFLSGYGPFSTVILYGIWVICLVFAYGLCEWAINRNAPHPLAFATSLYLSGSTFTTLGFGDVTPQSRAGKFVSVVEAANGLGLVAAVIGYLPVLYQSFSNREAHVIQFDGRAGSPPSAGFLISQHGGEAMPELLDFLRHCESWTAMLIEGHLSFPSLAFYRSHHDNQSWLAALCAMMDSCAILLTGLAGVSGRQPRMTFAMGRMAALEMMNVLHLAPETPGADRLTAADFARLTATLEAADLRWSGEDAEVLLAQLRLTYEPLFQALSRYLVLALPGWSPTSTPDNWQSGEDGGLARRLIDTAPPMA